MAVPQCEWLRIDGKLKWNQRLRAMEGLLPVAKWEQIKNRASTVIDV